MSICVGCDGISYIGVYIENIDAIDTTVTPDQKGLMDRI